MVQGQQVLQLEVTLFMCRDNATVASPECEQQVLGLILEELLQSQAAQSRLGDAGESWWKAAG